ncbi:transcriptional regulator, y4mF family [compost metagenome]
MSSVPARSYSPAAVDALRVMGSFIQLRRKEYGLTVQKLADKAGVSRGLVHRIERGDPKCEIGVVFEIAVLMEIPMFIDESQLPILRANFEARLAVLPKRIKPKLEVSNDF